MTALDEGAIAAEQPGAQDATDPQHARAAALVRGELVVARNHKYDGTAHWVVPGRYLGSDDAGHWVFQGTHEFISRPGAAGYTQSDAVLLIPHRGDYVATFFDAAHPGGVEVYVDLAIDAQWRRIGPNTVEFHVVDMDLDVIRAQDRGLYVDDRDEFDQHRITMNYPPDLCTRMERAADALMEAVAARQPPFEGRDTVWFTLGRTLP